MPEMPDITDRLLGVIERKLARPVVEEGGISRARWSYREAAAVLHCFDPAALRPLNRDLVVGSPRALLFGDTMPASGGRGEGLQTLRPEVRQESLVRLGSPPKMLKALDANPDRLRTGFQRMLEGWLRQTAPPLEKQSNEELSYTLQVLSWLSGLLPDLPPADKVREQIARRSVLRPFEHLAQGSFVGRGRELARLRDYVGVLPPDSLSAAAIREVRAWFGLSKKPPLVLHGVGGIGKSALVGRFLYEHSQVSEEQRFPFVYLAFDSPILRIDDPFTLLVEAVDQLARQYPGHAEDHEEFRSRIAEYRTGRGSLSSQSASPSRKRGEKIERFDRLDTQLFKAFGGLLERLAGFERRPALLVLDTFEEVQYRTRQGLFRLGRMLSVLQNEFPSLRVVISGRAQVDNLLVNGKAPESTEMPELEEPAAVQLLGLEGITEPDLRKTLVRQLGGNPLTLKLAARAVRSHPELSDESGIAGLTTRRFLVLSVPQELIQGQLYRRVLDHIHDEDVRRLAHPGMVLRRVIPAVIRDVLSGPCGVDVPDDDAAEKLFDQLRREHALVRLEEDGALGYRPEIRRPMLRLIEHERPGQVRAIHEAAVLFYQRSTGITARAEELYHRLALDQDAGELEARWDPEAARHLATARDELPPRAVAWLASHMDLEVDPKVLAAAGQLEWERYAGRQILLLLRNQQIKPALELLGRRPKSEGSPLYALEARVHLLAENPAKALDVLDKGLQTMPLEGSPGRLAEMLWLRSQAAVGLRRYEEADASLAQAEIVAAPIADPLCRLQILTQRALLRRSTAPNGDARQAVELRARLASHLAKLDTEAMDREPILMRIAVAELGVEHLPVLRDVIATIGVGSLDPKTESTLREVLTAETAHLKTADPKTGEQLSTLIRQAFEMGRDPARVAKAILEAIRSQDLSLDAANLAGIEEYREPWELEVVPEALP